MHQAKTPGGQTSDGGSSPSDPLEDVFKLTTTDTEFPSTNRQLVELDGPDDFPELDYDGNDTNLADPDLLPNNIHLPLPSPTEVQLHMPLTVFTALFMNGQILAIPCSTLLASKSPRPTASIPIPLRPTASQLMTVHFQWIDRLPFPKLRDSLIKLQGVVDLGEFLNDIFVMPSFVIRPGAACWDPRAWSMETVWARKWGWLFF